MIDIDGLSVGSEDVMDKALTTSQAAERLGCSVETVRALFDRKRLRGNRLGREYRISERSVEEFINGEEMPAPETPRQAARRKAAESKLPPVPFFFHDKTTMGMR